MAFEVRYPNGEVIHVTTLNEEAILLWKDCDIDKKSFLAKPKVEGDQYDYDWYDTFNEGVDNLLLIDRKLVRLSPSWDNLKESLFHQQFMEEWEHDFKEIQRIMTGSWNYLKPFVDLIEHWKSKGYNLVKLRE